MEIPEGSPFSFRNARIIEEAGRRAGNIELAVRMRLFARFSTISAAGRWRDNGVRAERETFLRRGKNASNLARTRQHFPLELPFSRRGMPRRFYPISCLFYPPPPFFFLSSLNLLIKPKWICTIDISVAKLAKIRRFLPCEHIYVIFFVTFTLFYLREN